MKKVAVFGSTGSIGTQTLEVCEKSGFSVCALTARKNIELLEKQARKFKPKIVAVSDEAMAAQLKIALSDTSVKVLAGEQGIIDAVFECEADIIVMAIMGLAALMPTIAAIENKKDIALANKETLVCAGQIIMQKAKDNGVKILPVDSEHSAVFQCLQDKSSAKSLEKIILTASGGPFFGKSFNELEKIKPCDALRHPNWNMGAKITIDSATMMNKGLELIEAMRLYSIVQEQIDIVIQRESIIHSMVQFKDGAVLAQLSQPDMKLPIQYALTYPERYPLSVKPLDFAKLRTLSFFEPDERAFPCLALAKYAAKTGGSATVSLNGANEAAVEMFLNEKIGFNDISRKVEYVLNKQEHLINPNIWDILEIDRAARKYVNE